jgi:hypothetical protein
MSRMIKLTKLQAEAVEWALDVMPESWDGSEAAGGDYAADDELPHVDRMTLVLSDRQDVAEDLAYRVGDQLATMMVEEFGSTAATRSLEELAAKIKGSDK